MWSDSREIIQQDAGVTITGIEFANSLVTDQKEAAVFVFDKTAPASTKGIVRYYFNLSMLPPRSKLLAASFYFYMRSASGSGTHQIFHTPIGTYSYTIGNTVAKQIEDVSGSWMLENITDENGQFIIDAEFYRDVVGGSTMHLYTVHALLYIECGSNVWIEEVLPTGTRYQGASTGWSNPQNALVPTWDAMAVRLSNNTPLNSNINGLIMTGYDVSQFAEMNVYRVIVECACQIQTVSSYYGEGKKHVFLISNPILGQQEKTAFYHAWGIQGYYDMGAPPDGWTDNGPLEIQWNAYKTTTAYGTTHWWWQRMWVMIQLPNEDLPIMYGDAPVKALKYGDQDVISVAYGDEILF